MIRYLLDTCVVSEISRPNHDPVVDAWLASHDHKTALSVLVVGEVRSGIALLPPGRRRDALQAWLQRLESTFAERILPVDRAVADHWANLRATRQQAGRPLPSVDGLLVATARVHGLTLVTRNQTDVEGCGVAILNPWTDVVA